MKVWTVLTEDLDDTGVTVTVYESKQVLTKALVRRARQVWKEGSPDWTKSGPVTLRQAIEYMRDNANVLWTIESKTVLRRAIP